MSSRWRPRWILVGAVVLVATGVQAAGATEPTPMTTPDVSSRWDATALFVAQDLPDDATGSVTFALDGVEVCSGEVTGGAAACSSGTRPEVGTYAVTAAYSGDETHAATSTSLQWSVTQVVRQLAVRSPDRVVVGGRALLRARLVTVRPCGPYAACRTSHDEGVVVWRVVRAKGGVVLRHRSVVEDGRARFRTPRLPRRGDYAIRASYWGGPHFSDANDHAELRVTRR
ncbi:Ig-like domain-containing protein [Nocardioides sp. MAHUQ-72]|uniref:Ig-like domain-containing protein n=1 Tax=unclassified Nocardioides TaxID=2615069 RepID=UPI003616F1B2